MVKALSDGGQVALRTLQESDASALCDMLNDDYLYNMTVGIPRPVTLHTALSFIKSHNLWLKAGSGWEVAVTVDGQFAGLIAVSGISKSDRRASLSYCIAPAFRGRGVACAAAELFIAQARSRFELHRLSASVFCDNAPSRRVLEKQGFVLEGIARDEIRKNGVFRDVAHYALVFRADS